MKIEAVVDSILSAKNIKVDFPIVVNNRLSNTLARVVYINNKVDRLEYNKILARNSSNEEEVIDIIKHECAHIIAFKRTGQRQGHNEYFKKICKEIGCEGAGRARQTNFRYKYEFICPTCNTVVYATERKSKTFRKIMEGLCMCSKCGTNSDEFILRTEGDK